jgi:pyridoxal phosphate enzyme (YggS family)
VIAQNIRNVQERIARACDRAGRDPAQVTLVAVSKTFPAEMVAEANRCGIPDFGENYLQELREKEEALAGSGIRWHFIGHLQTNKIRYLAGWIHLVHSVDSLRLAAALSAAGERLARAIPVLVEVNTTGEGSKFGLPPDQTLEFSRELRKLPGILPSGLMTMGPLAERPEDSRPAFRLLRELRDRIAGDGGGFTHLSMGMTNDFEVAVAEGATLLRIGTAIFGARARAGH